MRLLIATDSFPPKVDGVADTAAVLVRMLTARGHDVEVLAPGPRRSDDGPLILRRPSLPAPFYPELRLGLPRLFDRGEPPDGAIILTPGPIGLGALVRLPGHIPRVVIHTTDLEAYFRAYRLGPAVPAARILLRWMSRRCDWTLAPTVHACRGLRRAGHRRLRVWGRGVDTELFNPGRASGPMRELLSGGNPGAPLALYVGRLAREKHLEDLDLAVRTLRGNVRFAIVGDGPLRSRLERAWRDEPVVFTGYLRGEQLAAAYASADLFVFPSSSETFGQVVVQAMASGLPSVVVADSAPGELVRHEVDGLHIRARDAEGLRDGIARLAADAELRREMGRAAVESARARSWPVLVDTLESLLAR